VTRTSTGLGDHELVTAGSDSRYIAIALGPDRQLPGPRSRHGLRRTFAVTRGLDRMTLQVDHALNELLALGEDKN